MIDEKTPSRSYPLPHPENIASQDVGRIANAITMIDADIGAATEGVDAINDKLASLKNQAICIPVELIGKVKPLIEDLKAFSYVAINEEGTGFTTREDSVGTGDAQGEILVKKSDKNFDTTWADPRALFKKLHKLKETTGDCKCGSNASIILCNEIEIDNGDELPRLGFTLKQFDSDATGIAFVSHIFQDEVERNPDDSEYATRDKHGTVKIGHGIEVTNGEISVPDIPMASETVAGLVKIGANVNYQDNTISVEGAAPATHEEMGIVKLGEDFFLAEDKSLKLVRPEGFEEIIYQNAKIDLAVNGVVTILSTRMRYRAVITEDCSITLDFSRIQPKADLAFDLELIADDDYNVQFEVTGISAEIKWDTPLLVAAKGLNVVGFSKKVGFPFIEGDLKQAGNIEPSYLVPILTANEYSTIDGDLVTSSSNEHDTYKRYMCFDRDLHTWFEISNAGQEWLQIALPKAKIANAFQIGSMDQSNGWYDGAPRTYSLLGSNDKENWVTLFSITNSAAFKCAELRRHFFNNATAYKYYRLTMSQSNRTSILISRFDLLRENRIED